MLGEIYTWTLQPREETQVEKQNVDLLNTGSMEQFWSFIDNMIMYHRKQTSTTPYEAIFPTLVCIRCSLKRWEKSVIRL